ncbi:MAG: hypothetical protein GEU81_09875 [Nitriliruptorales bacterium]|nr:hypothetical protein [Nitriliruptorales bacterium]
MSPAEPGRGNEGGSPEGRRRGRLARQRRQRRVTIAVAMLAAALILATAVVLMPLLTRGEEGITSGLRRPPEPVIEQTLLLVGYDEPGGLATGATLLSARSDDEPSAVIFIPIGLVLDVPGIGLDRLALAYRYGGIEQFESTIESALRVVIDHTVAVSGDGLATLLGQAGPLTIDADERLVVRDEDGQQQVIVEEGQQVLDGERLAVYWGHMSESQSPLIVHKRQKKVLAALLTKAAEDPARLEEFLAQPADLLETDADPRTLSGIFAGLARAAHDQRLLFEQVPVRPFGGRETGEGALFRLGEEARDVVHALLPGSAVRSEDIQATSVHVRDGVGRPGIGKHIAEALEGGAFQVVLTDDADRDDVAATAIVAYEDSPEAREAAEAVRRRLGLGTIHIGRDPPSAVDVTIIVGEDLLETGTPAGNHNQASTMEQDS